MWGGGGGYEVSHSDIALKLGLQQETPLYFECMSLQTIDCKL